MNRQSAEAFVLDAVEFWQRTRADLRRAGWSNGDVRSVLGGIEIALSRATNAIEMAAPDDDVFSRTSELATIGKATLGVVASLAAFTRDEVRHLTRTGADAKVRAMCAVLWIALCRRTPTQKVSAGLLSHNANMTQVRRDAS